MKKIIRKWRGNCVNLDCQIKKTDDGGFLMAQKREMSELRKLIDERRIKDLEGVQDLVKELTSGLIQEIMDAELEDELGYSKYDYKNKQTENARNGYSFGNVSNFVYTPKWM